VHGQEESAHRILGRRGGLCVSGGKLRQPRARVCAVVGRGAAACRVARCSSRAWPAPPCLRPPWLPGASRRGAGAGQMRGPSRSNVVPTRRRPRAPAGACRGGADLASGAAAGSSTSAASGASASAPGSSNASARGAAASSTAAAGAAASGGAASATAAGAERHGAMCARSLVLQRRSGRVGTRQAALAAAGSARAQRTAYANACDRVSARPPRWQPVTALLQRRRARARRHGCAHARGRRLGAAREAGGGAAVGRTSDSDMRKR
jgi:hypothetical protein